ncbi:MAG: hypothetical protein RIB47_09795 [Cyclobacteriaceae bacterium]
MKKIIYVFLFALITSVSVSSCTEENITPRDGGEGVEDPWK